MTDLLFHNGTLHGFAHSSKWLSLNYLVLVSKRIGYCYALAVDVSLIGFR